jgi:hypothetical protein
LLLSTPIYLLFLCEKLTIASRARDREPFAEGVGYKAEPVLILRRPAQGCPIVEEAPGETRFIVASLKLPAASAPIADEGQFCRDAVAAGHGCREINKIGNVEVEHAEACAAVVGIENDVAALYGRCPEDAGFGDTGVVVVDLGDQTLVTKEVQSYEGKGAFLLIAIHVNVLSVYEAHIRRPELFFD